MDFFNLHLMTILCLAIEVTMTIPLSLSFWDYYSTSAIAPPCQKEIKERAELFPSAIKVRPTAVPPSCAHAAKRSAVPLRSPLTPPPHSRRKYRHRNHRGSAAVCRPESAHLKRPIRDPRKVLQAGSRFHSRTCALPYCFSAAIRGTIPIIMINANVPAAIAMPAEKPNNPKKACLIHIQTVPIPSRFLDKGRIHILFVFAHLHLDRCRIRRDLLLSKVVKEH